MWLPIQFLREFSLVRLEQLVLLCFYIAVIVVTANLSFESFALDHTTFALLLETTLVLSKKHAISVYIFQHLADFDSSMSLHKFYLMPTTFFGQ